MSEPIKSGDMTTKPCEFKDGVCIHCSDDHVDTDCLGWVESPPDPKVARLERELLAATIRMDNDAAELATQHEYSEMLAEINRLKAELASLRKQEPVAWIEWDIELDEGDPDSVVAGNEKPELVADGWEWKPLILAPGAQPATCEYCNGTGDVHGLDGEWRGSCTCSADAQGEKP